MPKDANAIATEWANRLAGATDKIKSGVQSVTVSPTTKAAQSKAKYVAGVQAKADKWAARLQAVSLGDWQNAMVNKGLPRIASGASQAQPKMAAFLSQLLPYIDSNVQAVRSMPSMTIEDSVNRAAAWIRLMGKFSYKK